MRRSRGILPRAEGPRSDWQGRRYSLHLRRRVQLGGVHGFAVRTRPQPYEPQRRRRRRRAGPNAGLHDRFLHRLLLHGRRVVASTAILAGRDKIDTRMRLRCCVKLPQIMILGDICLGDIFDQLSLNEYLGSRWHAVFKKTYSINYLQVVTDTRAASGRNALNPSDPTPASCIKPRPIPPYGMAL
jgi:hypothetical protein